MVIGQRIPKISRGQRIPNNKMKNNKSTTLSQTRIKVKLIPMKVFVQIWTECSKIKTMCLGRQQVILNFLKQHKHLLKNSKK